MRREVVLAPGAERDYVAAEWRDALVIVEQLSKVGIKAVLKTPEWAIFNTDYKNGKYPMYLTGRGSLTDANALFHQYFRTGVTKRVLGYSNQKLDEILEQAHTRPIPFQDRVAQRRSAIHAQRQARDIFAT